MTDMIKKLVDIDEQAKLLSRETEKEKERLARELEAEKKEVYDRYMLDAEKRVIAYSANREKWVDEIVKRTLG